MARQLTRLCLLAGLLLCAAGRPLKEPEQPVPSVVIHLTEATFDTQLRTVPADGRVLLEFYASWCPACRRFQPTYDQVAAFFHTKGATFTPRVVVAKVDCAQEVELCGQFKLEGYPSIFLAPASTFLAHSAANATQFSNTWKRKATDIVTWVAKELHTDWVYEEVKAAEVVPLPANAALGAAVATQQQAAMADVEKATVELMVQATMGLQGAPQRAALLDVLRLLAAAHPSSRCQQGAAGLVGRYEELWLAGQEAPGEELTAWPICGEAAKQGLQWVACADSGSGIRGFTCGMWFLFHSLAAQYPEAEAEGGKAVMAGVGGFGRHFFRCEQCAQHFTAMLDADDAKAVVTKRDAALWLWRTHNKVNARLEKLAAEAPAGTPQEGPPKVQWPTVELCPACRVAAAEGEAAGEGQADGGVKWVEDEVYAFLLRFFGSALRVAATPTPAPMPKMGVPGPATTVSQFVLSTLLFTAALLVIWYLASASLKKHRPSYRRSWA